MENLIDVCAYAHNSQNKHYINIEFKLKNERKKSEIYVQRYTLIKFEEEISNRRGRRLEYFKVDQHLINPFDIFCCIKITYT